jgi:ubiquinone biosynthesis protein
MWSPRIVRPLEIGVGLKLVPASDRGKWLRRALDGAGPTYIKAGQFISNRPDIFGKELSRELAPLRDNVTPFDFEQVREQVPKEVSDVNPIPFASASIAQVHRAKLKNKNVVLKIKRPGIEAQIKEDLDLIRGGTSLLNLIPNFGMEAVAPWLDEFERGLIAELDFRSERGEEHFILQGHVPGPRRHYYSTSVFPSVVKQHHRHGLDTVQTNHGAIQGGATHQHVPRTAVV